MNTLTRLTKADELLRQAERERYWREVTDDMLNAHALLAHVAAAEPLTAAAWNRLDAYVERDALDGAGPNKHRAIVAFREAMAQHLGDRDLYGAHLANAWSLLRTPWFARLFALPEAAARLLAETRQEMGMPELTLADAEATILAATVEAFGKVDREAAAALGVTVETMKEWFEGED